MSDSGGWKQASSPGYGIGRVEFEELTPEAVIAIKREMAEARIKRTMVPQAAMGAYPMKAEAGISGPYRAPPRVYNYTEKMEMRMNWQPGRIPNCFAFVEYRNVGDKAFMWILTPDGQSIVLEDDHALFPSDALITKVRMMGG